MWGLPYIIFRPHNVYGPRQNLTDRYRNVVGIFINQALRGEPMTIFGDGQQTRAFSYIEDIAPIIARGPTVARAYHDVFNLGADQPYTVLEIAEAVSEAVGVPLRVNHLPARHEAVNAHSDHHHVNETFGRAPATPLKEGIAKMVAWARTQPKREPAKFSAIEVKRGLPPSWR
jgi:UDP-glucose 4-epimerase